MKNISISSPGKLMLMGEHAVVYNRPCLVTAVDQRMHVTIERTQTPTLVLDLPDMNISGYEKPMNTIGTGDIPQGAMFVEKAAQRFLRAHPVSGGAHIHVSSDFSSLVGFGSSSASTVGTIRAFAEAFDKKLSPKQQFIMAYQAVVDIQGSGSGFDVAAALYGGTLYFVTEGKTIEPISCTTIPLIVGYTGVKADTSTIIQEVKKKMEAQPERVNRIYDAIAKLVDDAKHKMIEGDWERVGKLMDFNQEYLRDLGVSSEKLESLIVAAKQAGAWGAKLSGAGGGDCMIAVSSDDTRSAVESAIQSVGGQVIHITPHAVGTRRDV